MEEKDRKQFNSLFHVKSADSTSVVGRKSFSLFPNSISKYQAIYLNAKVDITFSKKRVGQICYTFTLFRMTHLGQIKNIFMSFNRFPFLTFTFFYLKLPPPKLRTTLESLIHLAFCRCRNSFVPLPTGILSSNLFVVSSTNGDLFFHSNVSKYCC